MDSRQVQLVQRSFEQAAALGEKVAEIFYAELFAIDPSLRRMFKSPMPEQGRKLLATLAFVIRSLHQPDKILGPAKALAVKHLDYGVEARHYVLVGNALLRTLSKGLGPGFTPEVRAAWISAYQLIADVMRDAAYGPGAWRTRAA
jgi:nitric oxide dioxygenase